MQVSPPKPKVRERPEKPYREWLHECWREWGYPFKPANPGDLIEGTCYLHGKVMKVYNEGLMSVCLECHPEMTPADGAKIYYRKDCNGDEKED